MESNTKRLVQASVLLAIAIIFQIIGRTIPEINQFIVGPIVNMVLILTAYICGRWFGVGVGVLTPLLAYLVGQLAAPLAPFIPFIMIGNAIYVLIFSFFMKRGQIQIVVGVILGSVMKFLFLSFSARKLIYLFGLEFPPNIANALAASMSIPQLITALIGGVFALIGINILSKRKII
ncbi:MAG: ECF transporter S component [Tissierellales bacterium]|nr:ECF transporter S component [Tissierellales bacterium]